MSSPDEVAAPAEVEIAGARLHIKILHTHTEMDRSSGGAFRERMNEGEPERA